LIQIKEGFRTSSGNFAIFVAIRRASSLVSSLAAERRKWFGTRKHTYRFK